MNCPSCGEETEEGTLTTRETWNYFLPKAAPEMKPLLPVSGTEKRGGLVFHAPLGGGDLTRSAYVCRNYRKIVMEY